MAWKKAAIITNDDGPPKQIIGPNDAIYTFNLNGLATLNKRLFYFMRRNASGVANVAEVNLGEAPSIHDLLDPTTSKRDRSFELTDTQAIAIAVGACNYAWGIHNWLVANDWTTLVGLGFECGPDYILKTFLKDAPAGVPRVIHQTVLASLLNVEHELTIIVDGWKKKAFWYVDRVLVDSYVPVAPLDQMGGTALATSLRMRGRLSVPAGGDATLYVNGQGMGVSRLSLMETTS